MRREFETDRAFDSLCRTLRSEELAQLEANILAVGIRDPLVVWAEKGLLLDGHNRMAIAERHDLDFETVDVSLPDRASAELWIIRNQLGRRNLTNAEASYFRGKQYDAEKQCHGGQIPGSTQNEYSKTAARIAKEHGVSRATVERNATFSRAVDTLAELGGNGAKDAILEREVPIPKKEVIALAKQAEVHPGFVENVVKAVSAGDAKSFVDAKRQLQRTARVEKIAEPQPLSDLGGPFHVILADPPWRYEHCASSSREIENQYPTMALEDICAMPVDSIAAESSILFLWATPPKLAEAMGVIDAWGFSYRSNWVWDKEIIGMGYWGRQQHEHLLIATRGDIPAPLPACRPSSLFRSRRKKHSVKPGETFERIEKMFPENVFRKVELFSRQPMAGWTAWGNEAQ